MAVPFYVPNDGGSSDSTGISNSSPSNAGQGMDNRDAGRQQDPLLGALCEALYRVLLARQGQGANFNLPPPPSPTCSPHQPNHHLSEVFFPSGTVLPLETNNHNQQNFDNHHNQQNFELNHQNFDSNHQNYADPNQHNFEQGQIIGDGSMTNHQNGSNQRLLARRIEMVHEPTAVVDGGYDGLRIFEGQVPAHRRRRICNNDFDERQIIVQSDDTKDDRAKECLTWPVVTAVLVAVGCGILRATR